MNKYLLETADVLLVTVYYLVFGFLISLLVNRVLDYFDDNQYNERSTLRLGVEIFAHILFLSVVFYFLRNFIKILPSPWRFNNTSLYEIDGGIVLVFVILFFQRLLIEKVGVFQNRLRQDLGFSVVADE